MQENSKFEGDKRSVEEKNKQEEMNLLKSKFSEVLAKNPIVVYDYDPFNRIKKAAGFNDLNKVENISAYTIKDGTEVDINFGKNGTYIVVNNESFRGSNLLDPSERNCKFTNESFQNILTMVNELLKTTGCSESDKMQITQRVVDYFKGRILKEEDLVNVK